MTNKKTKASATKKSATKKTEKEQSPTKNTAAKAAPRPESVKPDKASAEKPAEKKNRLVRTNGTSDKKAIPIVFSLDDVEALVASRKKEQQEEAVGTEVKKAIAPVKKKVVQIEEKPVEKRVLGAASLSDILGFNPAEKKRETNLEEDAIPKKWKKYYKLLIELRQHVRNELDLHTADTLKHSTRDDSGDLSSYGSHQADAGTDTFDRDFALSLVSNEQDALNEIEEAIVRIKEGTYGICEVTGERISKERLEAVPFARFSLEGQAEYEKNKRRKVERNTGGLFADSSDAPKITSDDDED